MILQISNFEAVTGLPDLVGYVFVFLFGAIVGSFLNVVIHRIPRELSIVFPNSACPKCGSAIKPYDNFPILSWLILRGKCRNCSAPISARYPAVELLTALLFLLVFWQIGFTPLLPVALYFTASMISLVFIDAEHMILPDLINFPLLFVAVVVRIAFPLAFGDAYFSDLHHSPLTYLAGYPVWIVSLAGAFLGMLVGGGFLWSIGWLWEKLRGVEAMGFGDVKMMFAVGALLGWRLTFLTLFVGAFAGAVIGVALIAKDRDKDMQTQIPFGIFLGIGAFVSLLFGDRIILWYLQNFVPQ
ncbi:MAG: prepilin peptidase [Acidobacteria bacterium]|nr:prepilin peptidase [Acidobacteriota bacterium]MBK8811785.1 prepilin peptidase [Acidobacteriota bacterium]